MGRMKQSPQAAYEQAQQKIRRSLRRVAGAVAKRLERVGTLEERKIPQALTTIEDELEKVWTQYFALKELQDQGKPWAKVTTKVPGKGKVKDDLDGLPQEAIDALAEAKACELAAKAALIDPHATIVNSDVSYDAAIASVVVPKKEIHGSIRISAEDIKDSVKAPSAWWDLMKKEKEMFEKEKAAHPESKWWKYTSKDLDEQALKQVQAKLQQAQAQAQQAVEKPAGPPPGILSIDCTDGTLKDLMTASNPLWSSQVPNGTAPNDYVVIDPKTNGIIVPAWDDELPPKSKSGALKGCVKFYPVPYPQPVAIPLKDLHADVVNETSEVS